MSQKRLSEDVKVGSEPNSPPEEKRQKVRTPAFKRVVLEAVKMDKFQKFLSGLEPLLRKIVKEEVEVAVRKHLISMKQIWRIEDLCQIVEGKPERGRTPILHHVFFFRNCNSQVHPSASRSLQLQFRNKLSLPIFTGARIEGEEGPSVEVALVDALTREVVTTGSEASAKVEIVVLEGDFEGDEDDNWSLEEFINNIVKEREGKRPLLTGDTFLNLNEGTSVVGELVFTDNSSWTRSRKFRLGARVLDDSCDGVRIREARTESFMVKDHRGELYKKHYPPSLVDEVWRLEKIGKEGAFHKRLSQENINTVKDFLTLFYVDTPRLRNILGTGMSAKMWELTADHARTCVLDNRMYLYCPSNAQDGRGVVFNVVGQVLCIFSEGQYIPIDGLSENDKVEAHKLVKLAFEHWEQVISCDSGNIISSSSQLLSDSFTGTSSIPDTSFGDNIASSRKCDEFGFTPTTVSSSDVVSSILSLGGTRSLDEFNLQGIDSMDLGYDQPSSFLSQLTDSSLNCHLEALSQSFCGGDNLPYFDPDPSLLSQNFCLESEAADLRTAVSGFLKMPARSTATVKAHNRWSIVYSLFRWKSSIKRIVKSKKLGHAKWRHG